MTIIPSEWMECPTTPGKIFEDQISTNQLIEVEFEDGELRLISADDFWLHWCQVKQYRVYNVCIETE